MTKMYECPATSSFGSIITLDVSVEYTRSSVTAVAPDELVTSSRMICQSSTLPSVLGGNVSASKLDRSNVTTWLSVSSCVPASDARPGNAMFDVTLTFAQLDAGAVGI